MARLGRDERQFCEHHGIPKERLFNATGLSRSEIKSRMAAEEKWAAYGGKPCARFGHALKDRHSNCLMCNPAQVAFMLRSKLSGWLYIAAGNRDTLMKLGFSKEDPYNRIDIANWEGWGGFHDWRIVAFARSPEAGRLESHLHRAFKSHSTSLVWYRNGTETRTREAYLANYELLSEATSVLDEICEGGVAVPPPGWRPGME